MIMSTNCATETAPTGIEYSIKVSSDGLSNNRLVRYVKEDDPRIDKYVPGGREFIDKSDFDYKFIMIGIDGHAGVAKLYLEDDRGNIRAIESQSGRKRLYLRLDKPDPRLKLRSGYFPQVLSFSADEQFNPISLKTTHLLLNLKVEQLMDMLLGLCKKHAKNHYMSFKEWITQETDSIVTWLGLSDESFTVYYMNEL